MSVNNGQRANQVTFNSAFVSRIDDSSTAGKLTLEDEDTTTIVDIQRVINEIASQSGIANQAATDPDAADYSSNNIIQDGDNQRVALGKIDLQLGRLLSEFDGYVGVNGTDASINAFVARKLAEDENIENLRVFIISPLSATVTQVVTIPGLELVFHPRATLSKSGSLDVGLRIDAPRVRVSGGTFSGFDETGGAAIEITNNAKNTFIRDALFSNNNLNVNDNGAGSFYDDFPLIP